MELGQPWKKRAGALVNGNHVWFSTNIKSQDLSATVFCMVGANQDATSTRRCDLSPDPRSSVIIVWYTKPIRKTSQNHNDYTFHALLYWSKMTTPATSWGLENEFALERVKIFRVKLLQPLKTVIFHSYVSFPEGNFWIQMIRIYWSYWKFQGQTLNLLEGKCSRTTRPWKSRPHIVALPSFFGSSCRVTQLILGIQGWWHYWHRPKNHLVGGFNLPLWKMMEWKSVGMMKFPIWWEK